MEESNNPKYLTISEVNSIIHDIFINIPLFRKIYLKGEISNYKGANRAGHIYFTLKDEESSISAVIFKYDTFHIKEEFKNGDEVLVCGEISTYKTNGTYQVIIHEMSLYGIGNYLINREKLKKKLLEAGYFNEDHKLKNPNFPMNIAVITGENSAAIRDFRFNLYRRWPIGNYKFYTCLVQGEQAPKSIIEALTKAANDNPDVILLGRGGGASDDLTAFDNEELVKFIYNLKIPLISAIGHEINSTFTDYVSDKHASTPTGACEMAVPNYEEVLTDLNQLKENILTKVETKIKDLELKINKLQSLKVFKDINTIYDLKLNSIEKLSLSINSSLNQKLDNKLNYLVTSKQSLDYLINKKIISIENKLSIYERTIELSNPHNILSKGYSIIYNKDNKVVNNENDVNIDEDIKILLNEGNITATVKEINTNE